MSRRPLTNHTAPEQMHALSYTPLHTYLRWSHKCVSLRVGVISPGKVSIVAGDDGVLLSLLYVLSVPLSDAGTAGVGQHQPTYLFQGLILRSNRNKLQGFTPTLLSNQLVSLHRGSDLLWAWCHGERWLGFDSMLQSLLGNAGRSTHVLIRAVGAAANQSWKERWRD